MSVMQTMFMDKIPGLSKMDITGKFTLALVSVLSLALVIAANIIYKQQVLAFEQLMQTSTQEVEKIFKESNKVAKKAQLSKVDNVSVLLAAIAPSAIADFDLSSLTTYAKMVKADKDISYAAFEDSSGNVLAVAGDKAGVVKENFVTRNIETDGVSLGKVVLGYNFTRLIQQTKQAEIEFLKGQEMIKETNEHALSVSALTLFIASVVTGLVTIAALYWMFSRMVMKRLTVLERSMKEISEGDGDLTQRISVKSSDAIDRVGSYFNLFLDKIQGAITSIDGASKQLSASSSELISITDDTKTSIDLQQSETEQVATAINEMAATVSEVARNATDAASATRDADEQATEGKATVSATIEYINILAHDIEDASNVIAQLKSDSESIGSVLDVIQGIAEQTNLLALNAAIEAARAGEQGRGFAVVADEVRTLASRTQESTTEIKSIIDNLQSGAEKAVLAMDKGRQQVNESVDKTTEAGTALEHITEAVAKINMMNTQIAGAAEEQNSVAESINQNITRISDHAEKTANGAQTVLMASTDLASLSSQMDELMAKFKI